MNLSLFTVATVKEQVSENVIVVLEVIFQRNEFRKTLYICNTLKSIGVLYHVFM